LYKKVEKECSWLEPASVQKVCSISGCVSRNHELFDSGWIPENKAKLCDAPEEYARAAAVWKKALSLSGYSLFYYEMFEREFDDDAGIWRDIPAESFPVLRQRPERCMMLGYDVAVFQKEIRNIGCSPLSCNLVAKTVAINEYCLFDTLSQAIFALERKVFDRCEPGPYRIFSVYEVLGQDGRP
jgi:hypothetical protein